MLQDPGNLEGDLQAGANTGYILLWVLVWSTVMVRTDRHSQALTTACQTLQLVRYIWQSVLPKHVSVNP